MSAVNARRHDCATSRASTYPQTFQAPSSADSGKTAYSAGSRIAEKRSPMNDEDAPPYRGRLLSYSRPAAMAAAQAVLS